jgi:GNAT superfamily N-acetyltransferase
MSGGDGAAEMCKRLDLGRFCYAAWFEGRLAAYGWVSFNEELVGELDLRIRLLPGEAYIWDCFTLPEYRGRRLYSALLAHIVGDLCAENFSRTWIGADLDNMASQRGIARAGILHVADLVVKRVLAQRMVWVQAQPGIPESLLAEARRAFLGDRDRV